MNVAGGPAGRSNKARFMQHLASVYLACCEVMRGEKGREREREPVVAGVSSPYVSQPAGRVWRGAARRECASELFIGRVLSACQAP